MGGIYICIPGMESLPSGCAACPFFEHKEGRCQVTKTSLSGAEEDLQRYPDCPLIVEEKEN